MSTNKPNPNDSHWHGLFSERVSGVILLIASSAMGYMVIFTPLLEAIHHAQSVTLFSKYAVIVPVMLGFGLLLTIFGKGASRRLFAANKKLSMLGWIVLIILMALGLGVSSWLQATLSAYGYSTRW